MQLSLALPLVTLYAVELGASAALTGLLLTSGFILPTFASIAVGRWLDRVGTKRGTRLGSLGFLAAPLLAAISPSLATLTLAHVTIGMAQVASVIGVQQYVAGIPTARERSFGVFATFVSIGQRVGPSLLGIGLAIHDDRWLLVFTSTLGLVSLLATTAIPGTHAYAASNPPSATDSHGAARHAASHVARPAARTEATEGRDDATLWTTLRSRSAAGTLAASFATLFALAVHQTFFPVDLERQDVPPTRLGIIIAMRGLASVAIRPFLATLTRLVGTHARLLAGAMLVTAVGLVTIPISGHVAH
ncbi:MAG: MFS transporter [Trueperaceae bacterium]|nr:MFS transporter [Trueperaceae bacterium]